MYDEYIIILLLFFFSINNTLISKLKNILLMCIFYQPNSYPIIYIKYRLYFNSQV